MRKTLAVVTLAAALTGGTATLAYADDAVAAPPVTQATQENADAQESDKTGLWGLLGLLGLAGLAKRKENHSADTQARR
ncbi:MAG: hypothetical protein JWN88_2033 [Frankiales bacterium]|jgi:MYXO-CTERM domain-containing protein|nr:hypothetical protein [Frankiales bacterium]